MTLPAPRDLPLLAAALVLALAPVALSPVEAEAGPPHCPPGHAKKGWCGNGPGYWEGYRDGRRDAWRVGDRLPRDRYVVIPDWRHRGYPPPRSGYGYVRVDERIFLIALATGIIVEALR
jgi:hypothetical protein